MNHYPNLITTCPTAPPPEGRIYREADAVGLTLAQVFFLEEWFGLDERSPGEEPRSNHNVWTVHEEKRQEAAAKSEPRPWRKGDRFRLNLPWSLGRDGRLGTVMVNHKPGRELVTVRIDGNKTSDRFLVESLVRLDGSPVSGGQLKVEPTEEGMRAVVQALRDIGDSLGADQLRKMVFSEFCRCGNVDRRCPCDRDE